mgnify:CR=1 FL=1
MPTLTLYYYSDNWQVLAEHDGSSFTKKYTVPQVMAAEHNDIHAPSHSPE